MVKPIVRMLFIPHHLIDCFTDVNASTLQLHLNQWKSVDENGYIVTVDILPDNSSLVRYLKNVLCVIAVKKRKINLRSILTFQDKLVSEYFCTLEHRFAEHQVENAFPFFICERLVQLARIERLELHLKVLHQRIIVRN